MQCMIYHAYSIFGVDGAKHPPPPSIPKRSDSIIFHDVEDDPPAVPVVEVAFHPLMTETERSDATNSKKAARVDPVEDAGRPDAKAPEAANETKLRIFSNDYAANIKLPELHLLGVPMVAAAGKSPSKRGSRQSSRTPSPLPTRKMSAPVTPSITPVRSPALSTTTVVHAVKSCTGAGAPETSPVDETRSKPSHETPTQVSIELDPQVPVVVNAQTDQWAYIRDWNADLHAKTAAPLDADTPREGGDHEAQPIPTDAPLHDSVADEFSRDMAHLVSPVRGPFRSTRAVAIGKLGPSHSLPRLSDTLLGNGPRSPLVPRLQRKASLGEHRLPDKLDVEATVDVLRLADATANPREEAVPNVVESKGVAASAHI
ncbi:hypothetical protein HKX48_006820 [Thoreauomyces humboldtii]|nr:hypothetical protein HKX48_006820 [Thoreauomyces humboldtii]